MASLEGGGSTRPEEEAQSRPSVRNVINQHFHGPVNQIHRADNCNFGVNNGNLVQNTVASTTPSGSSSGVHKPEPPVHPFVIAGHDVFALLNPIPNASHTRDLRLAPPNSQCFPGTRRSVMKVIRAWANSALILGDNPHIMWIYGYAGCGKSAIAQEVAQYFDRKGRLAAAFFFFRGSGDRSRVARFANTVAHQVAIAIPATAPFIEEALKANPNLATGHTSLSVQFERLVYGPINSVKWDRLAACLRHGPFIIVLDGLDECEDAKDIATFIEKMIGFFNMKPRTPLRFIITSRVENHIHQQLHSSNQVRLLDLVDHTSDSDIAAALDAAFEKEKQSRILSCAKDWPSQEDRAKLVKHIGGSYIFMTTLIRLLFDPYIKDGLTPMTRLPLLLRQRPDFDSLYKAVLEPSSDLPHFHDIISTVALSLEPLSISQIAELLEIDTANVVNVLLNLHSIVQIPGDDHRPITLWHTSLRDFLCSSRRSGCLHTPMTHHRRLAYRCITLSASSTSSKSIIIQYPPCYGPDSSGSSISLYIRRYGLWHWVEFMRTVDDGAGSFDREMSAFIAHLQASFPKVYERVLFALSKDQALDESRFYRQISEVKTWEALQSLVKLKVDTSFLFPGLYGPTELEVASRSQNWEVVRSLVEANTDVNGRFHDDERGIVNALQAACFHKEWKLINFLLEHGANPNVVSPRESHNAFDGGTPLAFASRIKDVKLATRLLDCGADPNLRGGNWGTALTAACAAGSLEIVELLLAHGAYPNLEDKSDKREPLLACSLFGNDKCARTLLLHKADPNIQDGDGNTALHVACRDGQVKVVECLLEFKVDTSIRNNKDQTAMQIAEGYSQYFAMRVLRRHGVLE